MERPISAASSGTNASHPATKQHRRNASSIKNVARPAGPSTVSLFVTNLRLLDVDRYQDWPNITSASFSNQDARTRIKCSEYALYQLFRLYDPATTAEKLQPFFPPLEPLQSVNLRAGLFRCLNEMKKSGVLAKDAVLRKTMLDDCQGDKFWEVCLAFSAVVLRKRLGERKKKQSRDVRAHSHAVAEKIGLARSFDTSQRESMLPLAIAHRAALGKVLERKQQKKKTFGRLYNVLIDKETELAKRKAEAEDLLRSPKVANPERLKAVEGTLLENWIGDTDLRDALLDGDTCPKGDGLLVKSFDHLWNGAGRMGHSAGVEVGLLQSLHDTATEQSARLRRWQHFHDRITASKPQSARSSRPASQVQNSGISFNRHRDINLSDSPDEDEPKPQRQKPRIRHDNVRRYDDILNAMREDLRKNSTIQRTRPAASPIQQSFNVPRRSQTQPLAPLRNISIAIDTSAGAQKPHNRKTSQTSVPLRSPMGTRVSSRSRSYDRPKIDGQREPIPLKAELFSPLKSSRRSSLSPLSANLMVPSPAEVGEQDESEVEFPAKPHAADVIDIADVGLKSPASPRDSGLGLKEDVAVRTIAFRADSDSVESASASDVESTLPARCMDPPNGVSSLAERTRKSMALTSTTNIQGTPSKPNTALANIAYSPHDALETSDPSPADDDSVDRHASLIDRTRQSISLAPPASQAPKSRKSGHHRSRTSAYPINQFATQKKARRSTVGRDETEKRNITPMATLMSPEAQYDSVFKSRPKIAQSPILSPRGESDDLGTPPHISVGAGAEE